MSMFKYVQDVCLNKVASGNKEKTDSRDISVTKLKGINEIICEN